MQAVQVVMTFNVGVVGHAEDTGYPMSALGH